MGSTASQFYERLSYFDGLSQPEQILRVAWFLQTEGGSSRFQPRDIIDFYKSLDLATPNVHVNLKRLSERRPRKLLYDRAGYYLEGKYSRELNALLSTNPNSVEHITSKALHGLSELLIEESQRTYLAETMNCYRAGAFRATIVMTWNLAYDHLCTWILSNEDFLLRFNNSLRSKFPKRDLQLINRDSFIELKEFETVETAAHAKLINKNVADILKDKLRRRNGAAHPSSVAITQAQADDAVTDLVHNVISKLQAQR